jgi:Ca2+-binding RTX toxin-like protein
MTTIVGDNQTDLLSEELLVWLGEELKLPTEAETNLEAWLDARKDKLDDWLDTLMNRLDYWLDQAEDKGILSEAQADYLDAKFDALEDKLDDFIDNELEALDDQIKGTRVSDDIDAGRGDDHVSGGGGDDDVTCGVGDDTASGGGGADDVYGDDGDDHVYGNTGDDNLHGGRGDDSVNGGDGADDVYGDDGKDHLDGHTGDDNLHGGRGDDSVNGGDGDDIVSGGHGADDLNGGGGADIIDYNSVKESTSTYTDVVTFDHSEGDKMDLSGIDANSGKAGNQAFTWIGRGAFSGEAGELRYSGGVLAGDTNGDKIADFEVDILGWLRGSDIIC